MTAATANAIPTSGVNPKQLDNVPFTVTAAVGVPLDQIPDLIDVRFEAVPHPGAATAQLNQPQVLTTQATAQPSQDLVGRCGIPPGVGAQLLQPEHPQSIAPAARR